MKEYKISVTKLIPHKDLDYDDKNDWPDEFVAIYISAETEDMALDEFHEVNPISCLDHFRIDIEPA